MNFNELKRVWKGFWQLADPKIWIASTIPMAVGGAFAFGTTGRFDIFWFLISLAGVYFLEIGKNAVNEIVDYNSGADRFVTPDKRTPFSGGKKTIIDGKLSVIEVIGIALVTIGIGCCIGIYIVFYREYQIFWVGVAGVFLAIFYSLPPLKLAYRGLGEFVVGLAFGPIIVCGIYLVMTHSFSLKALLISIPIGFLITNVLIINEFPDYEADKRANKLNCIVRLGRAKTVNVYQALFAGAFLWMIFLSVYFKNPFWLLGLVGLPMAIKSVDIAKKSYDDIPVFIQANIRTVIIYQITGLAMVIACLGGRLL